LRSQRMAVVGTVSHAFGGVEGSEHVPRVVSI
jgi:hypothetical protein